MMNETMKDQPVVACHLCGGRLEALLSYPLAGQVTSDCRPWQGRTLLAACQICGTVQKPLTPEWHQEVAEIYAAYAVYAQAEGGEQRSFDAESGANRSRSETIVRWLHSRADLPDTGTLLDIGCGNGSFLQAFLQAYPRWQMIGSELDDRNRAVVESIPGVIKLHTGPLEQLSERFDLIVMVHALEHIPGPREFLARLDDLLKPNGSLLIEVPDLETSPFDILITDHCTHFSKITLRWAVESAGHRVSSLVDDCVPKELTLLANSTRAKSMDTCLPKSPPEDFLYASNHLHWLNLMLQQAMAIEGKVGIFGTSISATWLAAALEDRVGFFVDEDLNRIGNDHLGRPIFSIEQAPPDLPILMPIRRDIALAVKSRLGSIHPGILTPPEYYD
jgi:2-polyprenyl-3-methyl-5-hydroxy-6-metoxy-1,4-benzoquinol methylase